MFFVKGRVRVNIAWHHYCHKSYWNEVEDNVKLANGLQLLVLNSVILHLDLLCTNTNEPNLLYLVLSPAMVEVEKRWIHAFYLTIIAKKLYFISVYKMHSFHIKISHPIIIIWIRLESFQRDNKISMKMFYIQIEKKNVKINSFPPVIYIINLNNSFPKFLYNITLMSHLNPLNVDDKFFFKSLKESI